MTLSFVEGNATVGTTGYSVVTESTTPVGTGSADKLRRLDVMIDFSALAVGAVDIYKVELLDIMGDDGAPFTMHTWWIDGPQILVIPTMLAWNQTDIVITKVLGTDRSIRYCCAEEIFDDDQWSISSFNFNDETSFSGTEYSLPNDSTSLTPRTEAGYLQLWLHTDVASVLRLIRIKFYSKVDGGTQRVVWTQDMIVDANEGFVSPIIAVHDGWDVTVDELNGNATVIDFQLRMLSTTDPVGGTAYPRSRVVNHV